MGIFGVTVLRIYGQHVKVGFRPSVQDRRPAADRTEFGPRPVRSIFWDRRSRFGPVDRPSVGRWTSLLMVVEADAGDTERDIVLQSKERRCVPNLRGASPVGRDDEGRSDVAWAIGRSWPGGDVVDTVGPLTREGSLW